MKYFYLVYDRFAHEMLAAFSRKSWAILFIEDYMEKFNHVKQEEMYIKRIREGSFARESCKISIIEYKDIAVGKEK